MTKPYNPLLRAKERLIVELLRDARRDARALGLGEAAKTIGNALREALRLSGISVVFFRSCNPGNGTPGTRESFDRSLDQARALARSAGYHSVAARIDAAAAPEWQRALVNHLRTAFCNARHMGYDESGRSLAAALLDMRRVVHVPPMIRKPRAAALYLEHESFQHSLREARALAQKLEYDGIVRKVDSANIIRTSLQAFVIAAHPEAAATRRRAEAESPAVARMMLETAVRPNLPGTRHLAAQASAEVAARAADRPGQLRFYLHEATARADLLGCPPARDALLCALDILDGKAEVHCDSQPGEPGRDPSPHDPDGMVRHAFEYYAGGAKAAAAVLGRDDVARLVRSAQCAVGPSLLSAGEQAQERAEKITVRPAAPQAAQ